MDDFWRWWDNTTYTELYYKKLQTKFITHYIPSEVFPEFKKARVDGKISDDDIKRAKHTPIKAVVERYGFQVKRGFTCCPFHGEKTASMSIQKHNKYKCFGCGASGDVIQFVMHYKDIDFVSAVKEIIGG